MELDKQEQLERQYISSCMMADNFQDTIRGAKKVLDYISNEQHRIIYEEMLNADNSGHNFDIVVISQEVGKKGVPATLIADIYSELSTGAHLKYYFKALKNAYLMRKTNALLDYTRNLLNAPECDGNAVLGQLVMYVSKLQEDIVEGTTEHIDKSVEPAVELIMAKMFNEGGIVGYESGIRKLDNLTTGFEGGRVYLVAGRPGKGKTALSNLIAGNVSINHATTIFSMEMTRRELTVRIIQAAAKVDLKTNCIDEKNRNVEKISHVLPEVIKKNMYINDSPYQTIESIRTEARRQHRNGKCDMLIVDHATLVQLERYKTVKEMLSALGKALKGLAKELNIPVILLAQLNRDCEKEKRKPRMSDIGESGTLEQDVDCCIFIHDEDYDNPKNILYQLCVAKNRGGETGDINVAFVKKYQIFEERTLTEY